MDGNGKMECWKPQLRIYSTFSIKVEWAEKWNIGSRKRRIYSTGLIKNGMDGRWKNGMVKTVESDLFCQMDQ
jgi:hypothetical protein